MINVAIEISKGTLEEFNSTWKLAKIAKKKITEIAIATIKKCMNFNNNKKLKINCSYLFSISILLANDATLKKLNMDFCNKDKPTNVLSFPNIDFTNGVLYDKNDSPWIQNDDNVLNFYLGDIAFSYDTILSESLNERKNFTNHFIHLFIHGVLHLLGYDHISEIDAALMKSIEIEILNQFCIDNPYIEI